MLPGQLWHGVLAAPTGALPASLPALCCAHQVPCVRGVVDAARLALGRTALAVEAVRVRSYVTEAAALLRRGLQKFAPALASSSSQVGKAMPETVLVRLSQRKGLTGAPLLECLVSGHWQPSGPGSHGKTGRAPLALSQSLGNAHSLGTRSCFLVLSGDDDRF